ISPAGFIIYDGDAFPQWQGSGLVGGLSSQSLVRIEFEGESAREAERFDMGARIREVEQGPDGAVWLLQDGGRGSDGNLLKLTPAGEGGRWAAATPMPRSRSAPRGAGLGYAYADDPRRNHPAGR